jgi:hypothetical protein
MATFEDLPDGWVVWSDEADGRAVLVYRPDVFDTEAFPPECLPTIYLTNGPKRRRRPRSPADRRRRDTWHVTLYLEPEIEYPEAPSFDSRAGAVEGAVDLASQFAAGDLDLAGCYQVPREDYLDRLDELTGRTGEQA